jgi:hypothetical protein
MPRVGFEDMIPVVEPVKTVHALEQWPLLSPGSPYTKHNFSLNEVEFQSIKK